MPSVWIPGDVSSVLRSNISSTQLIQFYLGENGTCIVAKSCFSKLAGKRTDCTKCTPNERKKHRTLYIF